MDVIGETLLNLKISNDLINNLQHMDTLRAVLSMTKNCMKNNYDKGQAV